MIFSAFSENLLSSVTGSKFNPSLENKHMEQNKKQTNHPVLLALCVEVLDEVLQQVYPFFDFDLVDFEEILWTH